MNIKEYIESGILELYVLGSLTLQETKELELHINTYPEISDALKEIETAFEKYTTDYAITPPSGTFKKIKDALDNLIEESDFSHENTDKISIESPEEGIAFEADTISALKPIIFCEGDIDVALITKAAQLLGKQGLLTRIEITARGSCSQLDKLWAVLIYRNWETVPQKKILLYDCDTNKPNEDVGHLHRRTIPKIDHHIISRGIENLFPAETIKRALMYKQSFFDSKNTQGTERGIPYESKETTINKQEKRNFCNWLLDYGTRDDFAHFCTIFNMIEPLVYAKVVMKI